MDKRLVAKFSPESAKITLEKCIFLANYFGSGTRDATGYSTTAQFTAIRNDVAIHYEDFSEWSARGKVTLERGGQNVLYAKRTIREGISTVEAEGLALGTGLLYDVTYFDSELSETALSEFMEGLKPIGKKGDILYSTR